MYMDILGNAQLFEGIEKKEIPDILTCLSAQQKKYEKGDTIIWEGERVCDIGILLSGSARSIKTDLNGRQVIVTLLSPGSYIGILLASVKGRKSPVLVQAQEKLLVLSIPVKHILERSQCPFHARLLENLLGGIAEKTMVLHDRNDCLIKTSIRDKVLTFLAMEAQKVGADAFEIPMGREAMAEYLNVDRSALSRELSWMKRDGLIDFYKSWFKLFK